MKKKIRSLFLKNLNIFPLIFLILITILTTSYFNIKKNINFQKYNNFINNIYLKKTLSEIINNLEPRYKTYNHKIKSGETFDKILEVYSIDKKEIKELKKNLLEKVNINKLNTGQKIQISVDKTNNKVSNLFFKLQILKKFIYQEILKIQNLIKKF